MLGLKSSIGGIEKTIYSFIEHIDKQKIHFGIVAAHNGAYLKTGFEEIRIFAGHNSVILTKIDSLKFLYAGLIHDCDLLIPVDAFNKIGLFDESLHTTQDYHMWLRLINTDYLFYYLMLRSIG